VSQFHFHPDTYLELVTAEVPAYPRLQNAIADAAAGIDVRRVLDLATGTGVTAQHIALRYPAAKLIGIDESETMLDVARRALPDAELRVTRLQDELPAGPFDLIVSALGIHHLDGPEKADLFVRVACALSPGGRFIIGDVVVPEDPGDVVTPIDGIHDKPSTIAEQLGWLALAGFVAHVEWVERDLAVLVGDLAGDLVGDLPAG
jgi:tRNA (cmo5U34)-methyltransferase